MFTLKELFSYTVAPPKAFWMWLALMAISALLAFIFYRNGKGGKQK